MEGMQGGRKKGIGQVLRSLLLPLAASASNEMLTRFDEGGRKEGKKGERKKGDFCCYRKRVVTIYRRGGEGKESLRVVMSPSSFLLLLSGTRTDGRTERVTYQEEGRETHFLFTLPPSLPSLYPRPLFLLLAVDIASLPRSLFVLP